MLLTTADRLTPAAGRLVRCVPTPLGPPSEVTDAPPSFNQVNHALATGPTGGWLCVSLTVPGPLHEPSLTAACAALMARHEVLRTRTAFRDRQPVTLRFADDFGWTLHTSCLDQGADQRRDIVRDVIDGATHSAAGPKVCFSAIDAADHTEFLIAVDHGLGDAVSMALLARDVVQLYDAARDQGSGARATAGLPPVGSFLDACRAEAAAQVDPDDPRFAAWHAFFDRNSGGLPRFPLPESARAASTPAATELRRVLPTDRAHDLEEWVRRRDARLPACLLAICAQAAHTLGLGEEFRTLLPVGTRSRVEWQEAVGWFVSNGPITIPGDQPIDRTIRHAQQQVRQAQELASMPLGEVIASYPSGFGHAGDVGMVSYVDYRRVPGHELHERFAVTQASPQAPTTDVQLWWVRDDQGLALRCRLPDTAQARRIVGDWLDEVEDRVSRLGS